MYKMTMLRGYDQAIDNNHLLLCWHSQSHHYHSVIIINNNKKSIFIAPPIRMVFTCTEQSQVHIIIVLVIKMLFKQECFAIFLKSTDRRTVCDMCRGGIPQCWDCFVNMRVCRYDIISN